MTRPAVILLSLVLCLTLSGCQTVGAEARGAVDFGDPDTRQDIEAQLAAALNRGHVELGPTNGSDAFTVTVLPPPPGPLESHSMALPIRFDIVRRGDSCFAVRQDTKIAYELTGIACSAR